MAKKTPRKKLKDEIDNLWAAIIKYRDKWCCKWCGSPYSPGDNGLHASHIKPRSKGDWARFDLRNGKALCMYHHLHVWHKDPIEADRFLRTIKTDQEIDELDELANKSVKYSLSDLEEMRDRYRDQLEIHKQTYERWLEQNY